MSGSMLSSVPSCTPRNWKLSKRLDGVVPSPTVSRLFQRVMSRVT